MTIDQELTTLDKITEQYWVDLGITKKNLEELFDSNFLRRKIKGPRDKKYIVSFVAEILGSAKTITREIEWYHNREPEVVFELCKMLIIEETSTRLSYKAYFKYYSRQKERLQKVLKVMRTDGKAFFRHLGSPPPRIPLFVIWSSIGSRKGTRKWQNSFIKEIDNFDIHGNILMSEIDQKLLFVKDFAELHSKCV